MRPVPGWKGAVGGRAPSKQRRRGGHGTWDPRGRSADGPPPWAGEGLEGRVPVPPGHKVTAGPGRNILPRDREMAKVTHGAHLFVPGLSPLGASNVAGVAG